MKNKFKCGVFVIGLTVVFGVQAAELTLIQHAGTKVTDSEFEAAITYLVPERQQENMRAKEKNMRGFLADYFTVKIMAQAARAKGLDKDLSVKIQQAYNHDRLLTEALINDYYVSAKEPDYEALAKEAYLVDKKRFNTPEQVRAEHILIAVNDKQSEAAALEKANNLYAQVKKDTKAFADIAKKHSDDPSAASNSGNLGFFPRDAMVKPFSDAAFAMSIGEVSKPVKTSFGYHIIHVLERREAGLQPFDAVKQQLINEQKQAFKNAKRDEIVSKFRSSQDIKVDEKAMMEFVKKMQQQ